MRHSSIRCIAFTVCATLALGILAGPETVVAAARRCMITPTSQALFFMDDTDGKESISFIARWNGVLHCESPTPFEGAPIEITQRLGATFNLNGKVNGTTQIVIEFTGAGIRRGFDGRITGLWETVQSSIAVRGEARAQGFGGSQVGVEFLFLADAGTLEVVDYVPLVTIYSYDHDLSE